MNLPPCHGLSSVTSVFERFGYLSNLSPLLGVNVVNIVHALGERFQGGGQEDVVRGVNLTPFPQEMQINEIKGIIIIF